MNRKLSAIMTLIMFLIITQCAGASTDTFVISYKGNVKIVREGSRVGYQCTPNMILKSGDWISTENNSHVKIAFDETRENITKVEENSIVSIKDADPERIELFDGRIVTSLRGGIPGGTFIVRTPSGICGARGTAWATTTDGVYTNVSVFQNDVFFRGLNKDGTLMAREVMINEGFCRDIKKYEAPGEMRALSENEVARLKRSIVHKNPKQKKSVRLGGSPVITSIGGGTRSGIVEINGVGVNIDTVNRANAESKTTK